MVSSLTTGNFLPIDESNEDMYAFVRVDEMIGQKLLVVLNFARGDGRGRISTFKPDMDTTKAKLLITNGPAAVRARG